MTSGAAARPANTAKGPAQVLSQSRQQLAQARDLGMPEECIRVLECMVLKEEAEMRTKREPDPVGLSKRARRRMMRC